MEKHVFALLEKVGDEMGGVGGLANLLKDHKGWDPVVPADLGSSKLPAVAADGTAECWRCNARLPFSELDIADEAYVCRRCALRAAQVAAAAQASTIDVDHVKIGRGRWWVVPLACAGALAITAALWLV